LLFKEFSALLERIDAVNGRIEITRLLTELLKQAEKEEVKPLVYLLLGKIAPDFEGLELGLGEKMILRAISASTGTSLQKLRQAYTEVGDLGLLIEKQLKEQRNKTLLKYTEPDKVSLRILDAYKQLHKIASASGQGSQQEKIRLLANLFSVSTSVEAKYIAKIVSGDIRLGLAESTIIAALADAFADGDSETVERAYNITCDMGFVAETLVYGGITGLRKVKVEPGRPLKPMLAERAGSIEEIFEKMGGKAAFEYKYDGERVQAHKLNSSIVLFSRRIENITSHYPDVVENLLKGVKADSYIVEGEIVAVDNKTGEMLPFQELMHRRRKYDVKAMVEKYPARAVLFDLLYAEGMDYTSKPYGARRKRLEKTVKQSGLLTLSNMIITSSVEEATEFFDTAIDAGCEGIMAKTLDSSVGYRAGNRGWAWIKYKREYKSELTDTIDLVIVGGFYGRGKRAGKIGGYLLAAYNPDTGCFDTVCKVATGFSDQDLLNIPKMLEEYKIPQKPAQVNSKIEADVWYRPAVVMEIIGAELTVSPIHTAAFSKVREGSGLAVRFPRFTGKIRTDKSVTDATTTDELVEMYNSQLKKL
jgi:DNA ligase-1